MYYLQDNWIIVLFRFNIHLNNNNNKNNNIKYRYQGMFVRDWTNITSVKHTVRSPKYMPIWSFWLQTTHMYTYKSSYPNTRCLRDILTVRDTWQDSKNASGIYFGPRPTAFIRNFVGPYVFFPLYLLVIELLFLNCFRA